MSPSPLRISVAGLGVVGGAVVRTLLDSQRRCRLEDACGAKISLVSVFAKNRFKKRPGIDISSLPWVDSVESMLSLNGDIVIELIGGTGSTVRDIVKKTIVRKKTLITANKHLLATEGTDIFSPILKGKGGRVFFEASVGGSIPIIRTVGDYLREGRIQSMEGILNGTCNWILTEMEREQCSMETALFRAQEKGYAEIDPVGDTHGYDALYKSILLSGLAFGIFPDAQHMMRTGIENILLFDLQMAQRFGYRLRATTRIAVSNLQGERTSVACSLGPEFLDKKHALATVYGVTNALHIVTDTAGELFLGGPGAGGEPTAAAVLADLVTAGKDLQGACHASLFPSLHRQKITTNFTNEKPFYIRFLAEDKSGVMQDVTAVLADHRISINRIWQDSPDSLVSTMGEKERFLCPVAFITKHASYEKIMNVHHALKEQKNVSSVVIFPTRQVVVPRSRSPL